MTKHLPGLLTRPRIANQPVQKKCQALIKDAHGGQHRCPNQVKEGQRYCGRHCHWNLPREAWDSSKTERKP